MTKLAAFVLVCSAILPRAASRESASLDVLENLYRIQTAQGLKTAEIARGQVKGIWKPKMTADECAAMGNIAGENGDCALSLSWYEETLRLILEREPSVNSEERVWNQIQKMRPGILCTRKESTPNRKELKCYMWDNSRDPWMILQPVKMEVIEVDPHIYRFYDFVTPYEITAIKLLDPALNEEVLAMRIPGFDRTKYGRHFQGLRSAWSKVIASINHRIAHVTGLNLDDEMMLEIDKIGGTGRPYETCPGMDLKGERYAAIFKFFPDDAQKGGATVFLHPGISVLPQKGSALFWYYLHPSGDLDTRTEIHDCLVAAGKRWTVKKRICSVDNKICRTKKGLL